MLDIGGFSPQRGLVVDLFAGGGGASTGIERALGRAVDVAINHDEAAIAMHAANHPNTRHYCKSVYDVSPHEATRGAPVEVLWLSPDCKHFSKAKGGKPRERNVRDLAWVGVEWARRVRPSVIILENVEEFQKWGPVLESGKPCKERAGETFAEFVSAFRRLGYRVDWRELKACDYGAPTIRKRLFLIARCDSRPIVWPEPTHAPKECADAQGLAPYRTAAECIDWSIPCPSIFTRKKPLRPKTHIRIAKGIVRYVLEAAEPFLVMLTHSGGDRVYPTSEPMRTITTANRGEIAVVVPSLVQTGYGERAGQAPRTLDIEKPLGTVVAGGGKALAAPVLVPMLQNTHGRPIDQPIDTIMAGAPKFGLASATLVIAFMAQHNTGVIGRPVDAPLSTLTTTGAQQGLVAAHVSQFYGAGGGRSLEDPLGAVTAGGTHAALVSAFLIKYYGAGGQWQGLGQPLDTVTTHDRFGLVVVDIGGAPYVISDIGMRMLTQREQARAQGVGDDYALDDVVHDGKPLTKTDQQRMIGNMVCPHPAEALVRANAPATAFERAAA